MLLAPLKIENWPPYGRFVVLAIILLGKSRTESLPVRLKSFGSVFSSFLSYILVLDVSWLFGGVSLRFGPLRANFGSTECLIILLVKSRPECFPVKLKSFGPFFLVWGGRLYVV